MFKTEKVPQIDVLSHFFYGIEERLWEGSLELHPHFDANLRECPTPEKKTRNSGKACWWLLRSIRARG